MKNITGKLYHLVQDEEGATAVEYGVLVALIIAVAIAIIAILGGRINQAFDDVVQELKANQ